MGLAYSIGAHIGNITTATVTLTIAIPAHSVVGVCVIGQQTTRAQGSLADSNSLAYTATNSWSDASDALRIDNFYILDSGAAATSLTYTLGGSGATTTGMAAWVFVPSGGTPIFADAKACRMSSNTTAADNISTANATSGAFTGNLNITTPSGVICSLMTVFGSATGNSTAGTSPTTFNMNTEGGNGNAFTVYSSPNFGMVEYGFSPSTPAPATATSATSTGGCAMAAVAFDLTATGGAVVAWLT